MSQTFLISRDKLVTYTLVSFGDSFGTTYFGRISDKQCYYVAKRMLLVIAARSAKFPIWMSYATYFMFKISFVYSRCQNNGSELSQKCGKLKVK